jgi:hypothetical protein
MSHANPAAVGLHPAVRGGPVNHGGGACQSLLPSRLYARASPVQAGELTFSSDIAYSLKPGRFEGLLPRQEHAGAHRRTDRRTASSQTRRMAL